MDSTITVNAFDCAESGTSPISFECTPRAFYGHIIVVSLTNDQAATESELLLAVIDHAAERKRERQRL